MKKYSKVLAATLVASMSIGLMGCGQGSDAGSKSKSENEATSKSEEETTSESGTADSDSKSGSDLKGKLVYWSMWNDTEPQGEVWQSIIDGFEKEHPDVDVEVQWCGRDNKKILKPALEGGETIDVFDYPIEINLKDYILDLTPYVDKTYQASEGKKFSETLLPSLLETPKSMLELTDIQPAVGYKPWMSLFMYNKSIFDEVGIKEEPKTWQELDEACAKIKEAGYVPLTFDDAYASWLPGLYLAREKGQDWINELVQDSTGEMWKDEAVIKMAKAFEDFAKKGYFDSNVSGNKYPAGQMDIGNGKVAMYYNLTGLTTEVSDVTGPDFVWGGFSFPDVKDGQNKAGKEDPVGCGMLAVNKSTEDPDLAMEFIAYALDRKNDEEMVKKAGSTPATVGTEWPKSLENMKGVFESNETALNYGADITSNADLAPTIQDNFIKLASGQISADDFVNNMAAAAKK